MGFGEMRLIAASTAGTSAADPASTKTTPSSPICTPMFPPAPAITKKARRTSRISKLFDEAVVACDDAALRGSRPTPCLRENAAQTATTAATRTRRHQSSNVVVIIRRTVTRRLTHNLGGQQEQAQEMCRYTRADCAYLPAIYKCARQRSGGVWNDAATCKPSATSGMIPS